MAVIKGNAGNDILAGTGLDDYIYGGAGDDQIDGAGGADTIFGGKGNDSITDGGGSDRLDGGDDHDEFSMTQDNSADVVDGGAGFDVVGYYSPNAVTTIVDFADNSKNSGSAAGDVFSSVEGYMGSSSVDVVFGNDGDNAFLGTSGNDRYFGRGGFDEYYAAPDSPVEIAFGQRALTLAAAAGIAAPTDGQAIAYSWNDANGNGKQDNGESIRYAHLLVSVELFGGTDNNDVIRGSSADEWFAPRTGVDLVNGGSGYDVLYYSNLGYGGVNVDFEARTAITLKYDSSSAQYVSVTSTILDIEGIVGSLSSDQLQGNSASNDMLGRGGDDALDGRGGADNLFGGAGDDILVGGDGNDILDGGDGADVLSGGAGVDTVSYASAATAVSASLLRGEGLIFGSQSGGDLLIKVENLVGSTFNDALTGDDSANLIEGRAGQDEINGCGGNDFIYGESAPNSPVEDYVPHPDLTDLSVIDDCDCDPDAGSHDIGDKFDDKLYGADGDDQIFGQLGDDELWGGNGKDGLHGGEGQDVLDGGADNDVLDGGLGTDFLYGGTGNDTISGGPGFDVIYGGDGTDTVTYDASPSAVTVNLGSFWQSGGDASSDLLSEMMNNLSSGASASDIVLSAVFVNLLESIASTGTEQAFTLSIPDVLLGIESVTGSAFDDSLTGDVAANVLTGGAGNDKIFGLEGNDRLDGGIGADQLTGGAGNDAYVVDHAGDSIIENAGEGLDRVFASVSYTLGTNVENLTLTGTAAINGTGSELANAIDGNGAKNILTGRAGDDLINGYAGDDQLAGGEGNDQLTGGSGKDLFLFNAALSSSLNVDRIIDFSSADDLIGLKQSLFAGVGAAGTLLASAFQVGASANDAGDRIIYDQSSGKIYFDADGSGGGGAILFARVAAGTALTNTNFRIIGDGSAATASLANAVVNKTVSPSASEAPQIDYVHSHLGGALWSGALHLPGDLWF